MAQLTERFEPLFGRLDQAAGGWLSLIRQVFARFVEMRATQSAASLAYFGLFSIFPLTLLLAALTGLFFSNDLAYWQSLALIRELFPFSGDLIDQTLREVVKQRGTVSVVSLLGLLWAATGFFNVLAGSINLAWPKVKLRGIIHNRLVAVGMVAVLFLLLLLSLISSTLVSLLPFIGQGLLQNDEIARALQWITVFRFVPTIFTFLLFVALYRWVPNKSVAWRPVLTGALVAALAWEVARFMFSQYLGSGMSRYQSIYGPLAAIVALLVWTYVSNLITLWGAYLVAGLDMRLDQKNMEQQRTEVYVRPAAAGVYDDPARVEVPKVEQKAPRMEPVSPKDGAGSVPSKGVHG